MSVDVFWQYQGQNHRIRMNYNYERSCPFAKYVESREVLSLECQILASVEEKSWEQTLAFGTPPAS